MIFIERVQPLGAIQRGGLITPEVEARMREMQRQVAITTREREAVIREAEQAREARIKATEAARAVYRTDPTTELETEARQRVAAYQAQNKLQDDRKRFMKEVQALPSQYSRPIVELIKAYDSYESLPGYSSFSRGASVREILPAIMQAHEQLKKAQAARKKARAEAWEQKHDIIEQQIDIEQQIKAEAKEAGRQRAMQRQIQAREARIKAARAKQIKAAEKKAAEEAEFEAEFAAHPFQEGSPPVSAAISEIAAQYMIAPGQLDSTVWKTFHKSVFTRARQLRTKLYYYRPPSTAKQYYTVTQNTVGEMLRAAGYTPAPAAPKPVQQYPDPRIPGAYSVTAAQQRARQQAIREQQAITQPQPSRVPAHTTSPNDPIIQEAIRAVIAENQLRSGQQIPDIAAFQRLVAAKTRQFSQTKTARPADITQAVDQRVRFILNGARAM